MNYRISYPLKIKLADKPSWNSNDGWLFTKQFIKNLLQQKIFFAQLCVIWTKRLNLNCCYIVTTIKYIFEFRLSYHVAAHNLFVPPSSWCRIDFFNNKRLERSIREKYENISQNDGNKVIICWGGINCLNKISNPGIFWLPFNLIKI